MSDAMLQQHELNLLFSRLIPEMLVCGTAFVLLMGGLFTARKGTPVFLTALAVFMLTCLIGILMLSDLPRDPVKLLYGLLVLDSFTFFVKLMLLSGAVLALMLAAHWLERDETRGFEYPVLLLFALLGMMLMVSSGNLMSLYMGLELMSLPLYVLATFNRDCPRSGESGMKYFMHQRHCLRHAAVWCIAYLWLLWNHGFCGACYSA